VPVPELAYALLDYAMLCSMGFKDESAADKSSSGGTCGQLSEDNDVVD